MIGDRSSWRSTISRRRFPAHRASGVVRRDHGVAQGRTIILTPEQSLASGCRTPDLLPRSAGAGMIVTRWLVPVEFINARWAPIYDRAARPAQGVAPAGDRRRARPARSAVRYGSARRLRVSDRRRHARATATVCAGKRNADHPLRRRRARPAVAAAARAGAAGKSRPGRAASSSPRRSSFSVGPRFAGFRRTPNPSTPRCAWKSMY